MTLPFTSRGHRGQVVVRYGVTGDAVAAGFGLVASGLDPERARGFPWIDARVDYPGPGYLATFGWPQVLDRVDQDGERHVEVDVFPVLAGFDCPLATFGHLPRWYDAPANPHHPDGTWTAESFLVAIPDIARTQVLTPLTGMRWGYRLRRATPTVLPLLASLASWEQRRPFLTQRYPGWTLTPEAPT